jgi:hypothetical protein
MNKELTFNNFLKERGIEEEIMVIATKEVERLRAEYNDLPWIKRLFRRRI